MAKHSLFQGVASGSIGDVTFYRREGVQVQRARVREIANPQTTGQAMQRAFLAPVARFYSPLAIVLERAYEGLNKSQSYSAFLKRNIELARTNGYYVVKGASWFPLPYQLTRGSIQPLTYSFDDEAGGLALQTAGQIPAMLETWGAFSEFMVSQGYLDGDQLTIIFGIFDGGTNYYPKYARAWLDTTSTASVAETLQNVTITLAGNTMIFTPTGLNAVAAAAIMSRWENNLWRRSTQYMVLDSELLDAVTGIDARDAAVASYQKQAGTKDSNIYLNGSTRSNTGSNASIVEFTLANTAVTLVGLQTATRNGQSMTLAVDNNGNTYYIRQGNDRSAEYEQYLGSNAWIQTVADATTANTVALNRNAEYDDAFNQWLINNGVPFRLLANIG